MRTAVFLLLLVALPPTQTWAQDDSAVSPWAEGVSEERKQRAQTLLEEGNQLFVDKNYPEALARYKLAIEQWDHPAIRFNVVRTYIQLDKPLEAYANLERALRYGQAPLEATVYAEAQSYLRLLSGQVAEITVSCSQSGVAVSVDGSPFMTCPGTRSTRVMPGEHQVVGEQKGFLTRTEKIVTSPAEKESVTLELVSIADAAVAKRRWKVWKPWAVVGTGAAIGGVGALLYWRARSINSDGLAILDDESLECFQDQGGFVPGCDPSTPEGAAVAEGLDKLDSARAYRNVAVGVAIAGGAVAATGLVMVYMNRLRPIAIETEESPTVRIDATPGGLGLTFLGSF